jgi:hypothetical protein
LILLNFSHPFTAVQLRQLEALTGKKIERVIEINAQIDPQQRIAPQVPHRPKVQHLNAAPFPGGSFTTVPPPANEWKCASVFEGGGWRKSLWARIT